jgi:sortase A
MAMRTTPLVVIEGLAWITGVLAVAGFTTARYFDTSARNADLASFEHARSTVAMGLPPPSSSFQADIVDMSLWSRTRIERYRQALLTSTPAAAILRIPSLNMRVPVYEGTSEQNLHRGAGRIEGTARLGETGNIGIAAHRDGFFRALKDIVAGDEVIVESIHSTELYRVVDTRIVEPSDVAVLQPTEDSMVTLVTCYPFYFMGSAPQRFIVRAQRVEAQPAPASTTTTTTRLSSLR